MIAVVTISVKGAISWLTIPKGFRSAPVVAVVHGYVEHSRKTINIVEKSTNRHPDLADLEVDIDSQKERRMKEEQFKAELEKLVDNILKEPRRRRRNRKGPRRRRRDRRGPRRRRRDRWESIMLELGIDLNKDPETKSISNTPLSVRRLIMTKFEIFLKELNNLERKHDVHLGEFFHFEDGPDEFEIWDGKLKENFSISSDYGHYIVVSRPFDTDVNADLEGNPDAGAELEGKNKFEIELPTKFVEFMDDLLPDSDCPWKSRSEFIEDCIEYFIQGVFEKTNQLISLMIQKRWPKLKASVELDNSKNAKKEPTK